MAFETSKFNVVKKKRLEKSVFNVECNVETNAEIDKLLSVGTNAQVDNIEILNGEINFSGVIDLCVIFATIDGQIGSVNSSCPFTSKFVDNNITPTDKALVNVHIVDYQVVAVDGGTIKISCACEQACVLILNKEIENVMANDENICVKNDEIVVNTFLGQEQEVFVVESQVSIKEQVKKVLCAESQVAVKNVESGVDFVSVDGEIVTKILYLSANDRFETCYAVEPFKQEVALESVNKDTVAQAEATIKRSDVKYEIDQSDKGVKINFNIPVQLKIWAFDENKTNIIKDVYSTKGELALSTESFDMTKQMPVECFETKIDGTLTLDDNKPRVDKLMFVGLSNLQTTNAYIKNGEVFVEGIAKTDVVYLNDETNALVGILMEVPFVISEKTMIECDDAHVQVYATLNDVDVVVKKGREFYFDAKLKICVACDCDKVDAVISRIEQTNEYPERDCAIEVYFGSAGQTAWDIAKELQMQEELVTMQNPDTQFPLAQDENIVVYYQKKA